MKKFKLKEGLFAGTLFTVLYIILRLWEGEDYSMNAVTKMVIKGLILGLIFGFIISRYVRPKSVDNKKN